MSSNPMGVPWEITPLKDFAASEKNSFVNGPFGSDLLSSELQTTGVPVIYIRDITDERYQRKSTACVTREKAKQLSFCKTVAGDVLLSKVGDPPCEAALYNDSPDAIVTQDVIRIHPSEDTDSRFLVSLLNSEVGRRQIRKIAIEGTRLRVSLTDLRRIKLPHPPYSEQERMGDIFEIWDEAIALTERRIEAARQRKKSLMQRLLSGRVRFPEFVQSSERFETKFGRLPTDWGVMPLQKLVKPISRLEAIQPNKEYRLIGVKWYTAGAHVHSILPGENIKTASLSRIEENDIIYNKMWATRAAFAVAKPGHHGAYGTTEYPQFRARENLLCVDFLEYVFHLPRFQYDATTLCRGTTGRARLNPRDFLKLEIPLPSIEEQRRIAAVLHTCDREIELLTQKRDALQCQKKGLMQRLLTGRVRVEV
jgi:type I restriction enzyme S subunit